MTFYVKISTFKTHNFDFSEFLLPLFVFVFFVLFCFLTDGNGLPYSSLLVLGTKDRALLSYSMIMTAQIILQCDTRLKEVIPNVVFPKPAGKTKLKVNAVAYYVVPELCTPSYTLSFTQWQRRLQVTTTVSHVQFVWIF